MKIDSINKPPLPASPSPISPQQNQQDFGTVFDQAVEKPQGIPGSPVHALQPSEKPMMNRAMPAHVMCRPDTAAQDLLDTLEKYQHLLVDSAASLKAIAPLVEQMNRQVEDLAPLLYQLPESHPVKSIIEQATVHIRQEIEKFNAGHYVDSD